MTGKALATAKAAIAGDGISGTLTLSEHMNAVRLSSAPSRS